MSRNYISESFQQRADSSAFFEAWVGARLARCNLFTLHHPFTLASETGNPTSYYAHSWDLDVSPDNKLFTPVEVKSVNLRFTEPNDHPHLGILVCSEASWNRKWPGAKQTKRDFLMVSMVTGGIVWLPKGSDVGRTEVTDKTRKETYWCITSHKGELRSLGSFVDQMHSVAAPWAEPGDGD